MKKFIVLAVAIFGLQLFAADPVTAAAIDGADTATVARVPFTGTDGATYFLRAANLADIDDPRVGLGGAVKPDRRERVNNGYFGVFIIENEAGDFVNKVFTGRMPLGVQPWPCDDDPIAKERLGIVIEFYEWLLSLHSITPHHVNVVRGNDTNTHVELVNNAIHAATVVISREAPFNTIAVQDAVAELAQKLGYKVAPDADVTPAGMPSLIVSIRDADYGRPPVSRTRVFRDMPYYKDRDGLHCVAVTSMNPRVVIPALPVPLAAKLGVYVYSTLGN